jgi:hypothetical protein
MFRVLAAMAIALSVDLYLFDGKYSYAFEQLAIPIVQHFWR